MDNKSCQSSGDSSVTSNNSSRSGNSAASRDQYLKHLNKLSHKIAKPIIKKPNFEPNFNPQVQPQPHAPPPPPPPPPPPQPPTATSQSLQAQQHQHQPPVYNINKNDFRDVVQKLTGSPAHERFPAPPPPVHQPKAASSRLQRIRPPPLAHLSTRPPPPTLGGMPNFGPLSPLPPLPAVHGAAESPVSAYMRFLQNSMAIADPNQKQPSGFSPLAPLVSPRWSSFTPPQNHPVPPSLAQQQGMLPPPPAPSMMPSHSQFHFPTSPLPFGCLNSPKSPYNLLSPGLLISPSSGQLGFPQLPLSPSVPGPSPRWRSF